MQQPLRIHLFQGYGIELEYMIVDRDTLKVKPITDELIKHETGAYQSDFENGIVTWSIELVLHVRIDSHLDHRRSPHHREGGRTEAWRVYRRLAP